MIKLTDHLLFMAIFLTAYFWIFRMYNLVPHSRKTFDPSRHILRQDLIFSPPGLHITKWTETLQYSKVLHIVQLPSMNNKYLCSVRAIRALLASRPLPPSAPLFAVSYYPHNQIIDTQLRDDLKTSTQAPGNTTHMSWISHLQ